MLYFVYKNAMFVIFINYNTKLIIISNINKIPIFQKFDVFYIPSLRTNIEEAKRYLDITNNIDNNYNKSIDDIIKMHKIYTIIRYGSVVLFVISTILSLMMVFL